jgi:hypothetical protein
MLKINLNTPLVYFAAGKYQNIPKSDCATNGDRGLTLVLRVLGLLQFWHGVTTTPAERGKGDPLAG